DVAGVDATVTFSDGNPLHDVTVLASAGTADLSGMDDGPVSSVLNVTDDAGNTDSANGATIDLDTSADADANLTLTITDTTINASEAATVAFTVSGIDADVAGVDATVTFSDGNPLHDVTVLASAGTADLSGMDDGPVSSVLNVTDDAGNTAFANGAAIDLDTSADADANLTLTITATTITASEAATVAFTVSGIDADVAGVDATVTFSDGNPLHDVTVLASAGTADLSGM